MDLSTLLENSLQYFDFETIKFICLNQIEIQKNSFIFLAYYTQSLIYQKKYIICKNICEQFLLPSLSIIDTIKDCNEKNYLRKSIYNFSFSLYECREYMMAENCLLSIQKIFKLNSFENFLLGKINFRKQKIQNSKDLFLKVLEENSNNFSTLSWLVKFEGMKNQEFEFFNKIKCLEYLNKYSKLYYYVFTFNFDKSFLLLKELSEKEETSFIVRLRAYLYSECGKEKESIFLFSQSLKTYFYDFFLLDKYSTLLWKFKDKNKMKKLYEKVISIDSKSRETYIIMGNKNSLTDDFQECKKYLEKCFKIYKEDDYSLCLLGFEYLSTNEENEALQYFLKSLETRPFSYKAWMGLGLVYVKKQKINQSLNYLQNSYSISPNNSNINSVLANVYDLLGYTEKACKLMQKYLEKNEDDYSCCVIYVNLLMKINDFLKAEEILQRILLSSPDEVNVYILMAELQVKQKNNSQASEYLYIGLKKAENDDVATYKIRDLLNKII